MKRFPIKLLAAAAIMSASSAAMALPASFASKSEPLSRMRKVERPSRWSDPIGNVAGRKAVASNSTPQCDDFQYIYAPDGSVWYASTQLDIETVELEGGFATEDLVKGYTFTIYDAKMREVGSIHDDVRFEEGEYKCARVMIDVTLTQKFFNLDANYEVMVAVCNNAQDYSVNTRTLVYSIGGEKENGCDKVLMTIPGYTVDAVDTSTDPWGENFFITFLTEKTPDPDGDYPGYLDYLAEFSQILTTYKKAGMNPEPSVVNVYEIPNLMLPGDQMSSPMMLSKNVGGKLTLTFSQYEKSYFEDPTGMGGNEDVTPDNALLIDVYQLPSNSATEMTHVYSTKIDAVQSDNPESLYTFYGIGTFRYDKDVDFEHYTSDGTPAFVVTVDNYLLSDDDQYRSTYCIYDADGNLVDTLAYDTYNILEMSDVPGQEPQMMFVYRGDEQMHFQFVDLYSCRTVTEIDQVQTGFVLSGSVDRVPAAVAGGYRYAISYAQGVSDEDGVTYALVGWFDTQGTLERVDRINVGSDVQLAQIYIEGKALSPYVFNTDSDLEYMVLVKRGMGEDDENLALREELLITASGKEPVRTFLPDEEKGRLAQIYLFGESEKMLVVSYINTHKVYADAFVLPFTRFMGGEGSVASPYLIASAGDLQQIAADPSAHYRLVSDIDCGSESFASVKDFTGSLDGAGHTIHNLSLYGADNNSLFASAFKAKFHDISFMNPMLQLDGAGDAALLVGTATMCEIDNINVHGLGAHGDRFQGSFGGIVGHLWSTSKITRSAVTKSVIRLPNAETVGGVVSEIRTGSVVDACVYSGLIEADNTAGGIVGSTTTGDESILDCRASVGIKAKHTVGGIVGYLNRSKLRGNFVEGNLEAYDASKWTKALSLGGIAGELRPDWEGSSTAPVVNNFVGNTSLIYPQNSMTEAYPHQCATVHRVVGRTVYNEEPETTGYDAQGKPIYKDAVKDSGIFNNIVTDTLEAVDSDFAESNVEGTSVKLEDVDEALLSGYEFNFGTSLDAPWRLAYPGGLRLFFEKGLYINAGRYDVNVDDEVEVLIESIDLTDYELSYPDDMLRLVDSYDMELEIEGFSSTSATTCYEFIALKPGDAVISAVNGNERVECVIHIKGSNAVETVGNDVSIRYSAGILEAYGCHIEIYTLSGIRVKTGLDNIDVASIPAGTYVAIARDINGNVKTLKFYR